VASQRVSGDRGIRVSCYLLDAAALGSGQKKVGRNAEIQNESDPGRLSHSHTPTFVSHCHELKVFQATEQTMRVKYKKNATTTSPRPSCNQNKILELLAPDMAGKCPKIPPRIPKSRSASINAAFEIRYYYLAGEHGNGNYNRIKADNGLKLPTPHKLADSVV